MSPLLHLIKFKSKKSQSYSVVIDFQQFYIRNVILFCTGLSMARILFGENIICQLNVKSVSQIFVDTTCFINGTMTVEKDSVIYHNYYQWVSVYLLLLAFGFYLPYSIWSKYAGNYLRHLEKIADKPDDAIQVIKSSKGNLIYFKTWALELFYIVYILFILYLTDIFFNNLWSKYEWSWQAIYKIFPDNGSCFVTYYQSSGSTDGKFNCLLPLSSVYRKIFLSFYGLFLFLILFNILVFFYRIKFLLRKKKFVNVWWAFMIVKVCATSWNAEKQYELALNRILCNSVETFQKELDTMV